MISSVQQMAIPITLVALFSVPATKAVIQAVKRHTDHGRPDIVIRTLLEVVDFGDRKVLFYQGKRMGEDRALFLAIDVSKHLKELGRVEVEPNGMEEVHQVFSGTDGEKRQFLVRLFNTCANRKLDLGS